MINIVTVESKKDWDRFINFPYQLYQNHPHWVPPLRMTVKETLDLKKNPFYKHAYIKPFLAIKEGKVVGRIAGVVDEKHNQFHNERTAFFGFFESINDQEVANALFSAVRGWAKEWGMERMRGPMNPSTNHECGLLVEGFNISPTVMMTYNFEYYPELIEKAGFQKAKDLYSWVVDSTKSAISDRMQKHVALLEQKAGIKYRTANMKKFDEEIETVFDIYNDAWENNWGFVPMDREEFVHMAKDLKMLLDPKLLMIAEVQGKPAAFGLAVHDANVAFKAVGHGKLTPAGLAKLLWYLKGPGFKKTKEKVRVITLGVKKQYRSLGLGPLLYGKYFQYAHGGGCRFGEASWILEDNQAMNGALHQMDFKRDKVYRIYDQNLS